QEQGFEVENIPAGSTTATVAVAEQTTAPRRLAQFYALHVQPFLRDQPPSNAALWNEMSARHMFDDMTSMPPASMHDSVRDLREIVEERRQIARHRRYYHWLHGWLIFHVPLSYALVV